MNNVTIGTSSTLTLGGTVTYDATGNQGSSTISGGILELGGNRTFNIGNLTAVGSDLFVSSVISGTGNSLTKTGAGVLKFSGAASTYTGDTIINGGQIFLSGTVSSVPIDNVIAAGGNVIVNATTAGGTASLNLDINRGQTIGTLTFGGADATSTSTNTVTIGSGSTLTLGGTVSYDATNNPLGATISGAGTLALGATRTFSVGNSTNAASDLSISSVISGTGFGLTKTGAGLLSLTGANTYTGGTTVSAGTLFVNNTTGSGVGTGALTVQSGATLAGGGFIAAATTILSGAQLSPSTLTFSSGLTLNDGAIFNFRLGTISDKLVLSGGVLTGSTTAGALTLNLSDSGGFAAGVYTLFDYSTGGTTTSSFDVTDFAFGTTIAGYTYSLGISGSMLQLTALSAIPEPSTYAVIMGLGALGFVIWRRRQSIAAPAPAENAVD